ncbi:hypothetical protein ABTN24_20175, partial [Acinetobacter baumannii]
MSVWPADDVIDGVKPRGWMLLPKFGALGMCERAQVEQHRNLASGSSGQMQRVSDEGIRKSAAIG